MDSFMTELKYLGRPLVIGLAHVVVFVQIR